MSLLDTLSPLPFRIAGRGEWELPEKSGKVCVYPKTRFSLLGIRVKKFLRGGVSRYSERPSLSAKAVAMATATLATSSILGTVLLPRGVRIESLSRTGVLLSALAH